MDTFDRFFSRTSRFTFDTLFDFTPITDAQKYHLTKVYTTLAFSTLLTFFTVAIDGPWRYIDPSIAFIFAVVALLYIFFSKSNGNDVSFKKFVAFAILSISMGITERTYIREMFDLRPDLVNTALMSAVGIFTSFSMASMFLQERTTLYLGAFLLSFSWYITLVQFANIFFRSYFAQNMTLFLSILLFAGYVVLDTQFVLKSVEENTHDVTRNALLLYVDLFSLFMEILKYLSLKEEKKNKDKEKKNKDRNREL